MAQLTSVGHIQTCMTSKQYISYAGNFLRLENVENRLQFYQVSEADRLKDACLLATYDLTQVLKVMDGTNKLPPEVPPHRVALVGAPCSIVQGRATYIRPPSIIGSAKKKRVLQIPRDCVSACKVG